jgi:DNA repair exonuclease SbcCD ATPase subunit
MTSNNKEYLDEYIYKYIDDLIKSSDKYKDLSENVKERLSDLFESIDDEDCKELLSNIEEINKYLTTVNELSTKELTSIKNNGKKLIEKYNKHKKKILSLKTKYNILEEELSTIKEQKDKALLKVDELTDEYYKLYQEKNTLEMHDSLKQDEEKEKEKLNKQLLNEEINDLNEKNDYLNKTLEAYEYKIDNLSKLNDELFEMNSKLQKDIEYKDKSLEVLIEKNAKLNQDNKDVMFMNSGLQKTIEVFENQFKDNDKIIQQLKEQISNYEQLISEKKANYMNSALNEEENKSNESDDVNSDDNDKDNEKENEENKNKKQRADSGAGINLNDLINDESESSELVTIDKKSHFSKSKNGLKSPMRSSGRNKKFHIDEFSYKTPKKNLYNGFDNYINKRTASNILIKLQNYRIRNNNQNCKKYLSKNDEAFLSELLFRLIDC